MIERVRYAVPEVKASVRIPDRKETNKDDLGAQMHKDADHQALQRAGMVWQRHQKEQKQCWSDWTEILGPALVKVQDEAMAVASTNRPKGKRYAQAVSGILKSYHLDEIDCATRSHAINIVQNLEAVTNWRAKQQKPERLNHPTTVWRAFVSSEEWHAIQAGLGIERKKRDSLPKTTKKQTEALQTELDTARIKGHGALEEKKPTASVTKEDDDSLSIPSFLDRTDPRGALATLLARGQLTLQDVPSHATSAALAALAEKLADLAAAMKESRRSAANGTEETSHG